MLREKKLRRWIPRLTPFVLLLVLGATAALARVGGGEHYNSGRSSDSGGGSGDGGGVILELVLRLLLWLLFSHPLIGIPVTIFAIWVAWKLMQDQTSDGRTRKALDRVESEKRTAVSAKEVDGWTQALKAADPGFDLVRFLDRTKTLFVDVQEAWFKRELSGVRRYLSDATWQRLTVQLRLLELQGVRDAIADVQVVDLKIIGLEQNPAFETLHVRVQAKLRDDDVPAKTSDADARAQALRAPLEPFTEVWSFVRKPGVKTLSPDTSQGKCPNCGAPFEGGAANTCEFCKAIVNSGNYDWVLSEITQGSEFEPARGGVEGLAPLRQRDPGFATEILEDRASLIFWKWVDAQVANRPEGLVKLASPEQSAQLQQEVGALAKAGKRRYFLECAVGAVNTLALSSDGGADRADLELRWSAKSGVGEAGKVPGNLLSTPRRMVMTLARKVDAQTSQGNGMATSRCPGCGAPLSDNGAASCEYCGQLLASGEKDWVLTRFIPWEQWVSASRGGSRASPRAAVPVPDREERERLVYLMAAMAMADGVVDDRERKLLKTASDRWSVPWANVELALQAGPNLFDRLLEKGSVEAEEMLRQLVAVALVDGKIDRKEKALLDQAAAHLGLTDRLPALLKEARPA